MQNFKLILATVVVAGTIGSLALANDADDADWTSAGQNLKNTRSQSNEHRLGPANVPGLTPKWVFTTGGDVSATPAVDEHFVYVPDAAGSLFKIDRRTGAQVWAHKIDEYSGLTGDCARATPAIAGNKLILGDQAWKVGGGARVFAIDKVTGKLLWATKVDDHPAAVITQSAVVHDGKVYVGVSSAEETLAALQPGYPCCTFRGSMTALDLRTGALLWKTYTVPDASTPGFSGGAVWGSTPVIDPDRKSVYINTGNNYTVPQAILDCAKAADAATVKACIDAVPGSARNYLDSMMAMDLNTGRIRWATPVVPFDPFTVACVFAVPGNEDNCSDPRGPDYDFGQGSMLFRAGGRDLLGAGQKSGVFWAVDPSNGQVVWHTQVGPGGSLGGLQWGSATDGRRIYTAVSNNYGSPWTLPDGTVTNAGLWAALDPATGAILWQTAGTPAVTTTNQGPVSVANGVVYAGTVDTAGTMYALDAANGKTLWTFASGGSVNSGAAIVNGTVYWGSGYGVQGIGLKGNNKLYAFSAPHCHDD
ncbi:MAG: Pyrrolo-quinoline quinone repeat-containing protein [Myxococcaceae bacterium]|nr:Pyrrolo-quinoline quinone repeat-containing protein [Myxococcaceae bacterium]